MGYRLPEEIRNKCSNRTFMELKLGNGTAVIGVYVF